MQNNLITGYPRVGKTTLINDLARNLYKSSIGMITKEIREKGKRIGFKIETLSGSEFLLASKHNKTSRYRVANYGVYLENLDRVVDILETQIQEFNAELIIIDEIGKMELFSNRFERFLEYCLDTKKVLGTISLKDNDYTRQIKERSDTIIYHLAIENRNIIKNEIMELLK